MNRTRKLGISAAAALTMATGMALLASATPAQAAPSCQTGGQIGQDGGSGWVSCTGVTSARVQIRCQDSGGSQGIVSGNWVGPGSISSARCQAGTWLVSVTYQYQL
ncbi:hypothetical protein [Micromonospora sagamiensis]|uniref:Uncharacterized protein n=1 Tax=Micromonospora sagamiensis TaxID=47875 RepID=A0A562WKB0_9ACTN|nr:hypothetical protein [Micromonospora sagamiensis]TWJ30612.1 hypothetical protein JD81_04157 [Micromonospora sagamiensis]BCL16356.1 hypothetical protein GCM10017556_40950 [Micromonospora sagamiensis]